jgi:CheY-like chemotaxis protein
MIPCTLLANILKISNGSRSKKPVSKRSGTVHKGMSTLRVLLAEDNEVNIKVMKNMLDRIGVKHIDIARNGEEAVTAEAAKVFDLVLMDMSMPIMDGLCASRLICARHRETGQPNPKIVFVTAHVSPDFEDQCRQAGGSGFLPKPFKVDKIEKCLKAICDEKERS